jgi:hypothetical protein
MTGAKKWKGKKGPLASERSGVSWCGFRIIFHGRAEAEPCNVRRDPCGSLAEDSAWKVTYLEEERRAAD